MGGRVDVGVVLDLLKADGYQEVRQNGSHHQYSKNEGGGTVTVPWSNIGDELPLGTAKSIARQAGAHIEQALRQVMNGSPLKKQIKALKQGMEL